MTQASNRYRTIRLVLFVTLWLTLFVLSVKASAGWTTRSLSVMAESLYTLISSYSTLLSLFAVTAIDRPNGREAYGHGKRETSLTLLLTAFLGFACLNLLTMSAAQLAAVPHGGTLPHAVRVSPRLLELLGFLVTTSLGLAIACIHQAARLNSPALRFNARQQLTDAGLTLLVIGALATTWWGVVWLDVVLAIVLVILAVVSAWQVLKWHLPLFVQQTAIAPEVLAQIARHNGGITNCYKIRSRGVVGRLVYVQMHLVLHPDFGEVAPEIAARIEAEIQERFGPVQVTFFIENAVLPPGPRRNRGIDG